MAIVRNINTKFKGQPGRDSNCVHCSVVYILDSVFGKNLVATPNYGVDEVSGAKIYGRLLTPAFLDSIFDGVKTTSVGERNAKEILSFNDLKSSIPSGTTGIVSLKGSFFNKFIDHAINYECDLDGNLALVDTQIGRLFNETTFHIIQRLFRKEFDIYDFSEASIRPGAEEILKYLAK